jgi:hypothetical protein
MSQVKIGGAWRTPAQTYVKVAGVWRVASQTFVKVGGVWKAGDLGAPPAQPVVSHTAYGQFTIANLQPSVTYTFTRLSGSGTATRNGSVVTLSSADARFQVTAGYGASGPQTDPAFMERKSYTYHMENHQYACGSHQCNCRQDWGSCGCGTCGGYPTPNAGSWGQCGCPGDMCWYNPVTVCDTCTSYCDNWVQVRDATPAGYADKFGEWSKVT